MSPGTVPAPSAEDQDQGRRAPEPSIAGREPAPMADDYAAVVARDYAWVAEHGDFARALPARLRY